MIPSEPTTTDTRRRTPVERSAAIGMGVGFVVVIAGTLLPWFSFLGLFSISGLAGLTAWFVIPVVVVGAGGAFVVFGRRSLLPASVTIVASALCMAGASYLLAWWERTDDVEGFVLAGPGLPLLVGGAALCTHSALRWLAGERADWLIPVISLVVIAASVGAGIWIAFSRALDSAAQPLEADGVAGILHDSQTELISEPAACPAYRGLTCDGWVTDVAGIFSDEPTLEARAAQFVTDTGFGMVVVAVNQTDGLGPRTFASGLRNTWGVGDPNVGDGVVVLLSVTENWLEISTGYGATLPNETLNEAAEAGTPYLRIGGFDAGVSEVLDTLTFHYVGD